MSSASDPGRRAVADVTCLGCGCLCDDLTVHVEGETIVDVRTDCDLGRRWFRADHGRSGLPVATIDGQAATADEALDRAAELLTGARSPIVLGLTATTCEAVGAALAVSDRIGAAVDVGTVSESIRRLVAFQRVGRVSATLGEVKNRADVVIFWGCDPLSTHPRHGEQYSIEPSGRFLTGDRAVLVADQSPTETARRADLFLPIRSACQVETLWTLRALVRGVTLDPDRVREATGLDLPALQGFAARLSAARYGAFFVAPDFGAASGGSILVEAALLLVRDLNEAARFVILSLGGPGNPAGAEAVATWQTGASTSVSLARGIPDALFPATSAVALLERGQADVALIVGTEALGLSDAARAALRTIPRVQLGPMASRSDIAPTVALNAARVGIDAGGTVIRTDGVSLPLRPPLATDRPDELAWLTALRDRLESRTSEEVEHGNP